MALWAGMCIKRDSAGIVVHGGASAGRARDDGCWSAALAAKEALASGGGAFEAASRQLSHSSLTQGKEITSELKFSEEWEGVMQSKLNPMEMSALQSLWSRASHVKRPSSPKAGNEPCSVKNV